MALAVMSTSCAAAWVVRAPPPIPYDAVIVPGCPSEEDGSLTRCQLGRAGLAAILWRNGEVQDFIVSGGAVHSPYVEAVAIAQAMVVLGVPAARIVIEGNAFHTDENMYFSLQLARLLGAKRLAVASSEGHAAGGCRMLSDWGPETCAALPMDEAALAAFLPPFLPRLQVVRAPRVPQWQEMEAREEVRSARTGQERPPSYLLYPLLSVLRCNGALWRPVAPKHPRLVRFNELSSRGSHGDLSSQAISPKMNEE